MKHRRLTALVLKCSALVAPIAAVVAAALASCATVDEVHFGELGCVAERCQGTGGPAGSSSSTGGSCTVNAACAVSFKADVFAAVLDGAAGCSGDSCHAAGNANGNLELNAAAKSPGAAEAAYNEIVNYTLDDKPAGSGGPYITPCFPDTSRMLCNLAVEAGGNPYPACGTGMPIGKTITKAQFDKISEWIACGAPDN